FYIKLFVIMGLLGGGGYYAWRRGSDWLNERNRPHFRISRVETGDIRITRNATGTVQPVRTVHVGSFVSGPIEELSVDYNDEVKKGQLLATIDPRIYAAAVARDTAGLATRQADVRRVEAQLQRAVNDEKRALALQAENEDYISQTELDQYHFARTGLDAELTIAKASVEQAVANLENSNANLQYTKITSPVDGIVTDRKIDDGQTLAAQFQAPELFEIAPDMRKKMHIVASIDEADMGMLMKAQKAGEPVLFKVDAYPNQLFEEGKIEQIRLSFTTTQNVVTYPVVVATPNPDMQLLPGMTADLTFQVANHTNVMKVPNAAIRYLPLDKEYVHEEDHDKLDFSLVLQRKEDNSEAGSLEDKPIDEVDAAAKKAATRHVWIVDGEKLRAVEIQVGVDDYQFTEVVSGNLKSGDEVVTGLKPKT
ncbi:MAG: efflux RND transporter periplasmic adaptor subunit, partial [Fuerstiella sp.]|nr:efflux RND transporter periplasmic adaptor subunit [Fuerstiella sp.]